MSEQAKALQDYFNLMTMNGSVYIFHTANKMGLLKPFATGPKKLSEVCGLCEVQERPTGLVLNALVEMGLLTSNKDTYSPTMLLSLLSGDYENLSSNYWDHLPVLLKTNTPLKEMDSVKKSEEEYQKQVKSLEWMMKPSSLYLAKSHKVGSEFNGLKILDFGAGSGVWSFSMLQNDPTSTATLLDWPAVLSVAKDSASKLNISKRVNYLEGNYHETILEDDEFDIAIIANVTHIEDEAGNAALFTKAYNALKKGGKLIIVDVFGTNPKGSLSKNLYEIGLALRTQEGKVYHQDLISKWMKEIGFSSVQYGSIDELPFTMGQVVGIK